MDFEILRTSLQKAFEQYVVGIINGLPGVISGLVILLFGWLIAKLLRSVVRGACNRSGLDAAVAKGGFSKVLGKVGVRSISAFLAGVVNLFVLLVFIVAAAESMHLTGVTHAISALFAYMPTFFTAAAIFLVGIWGADMAKSAVLTMLESAGMGSAKMLASVLYGTIVVFTSITALNMAGVDTTLISSNIVIIMAGILIAFCIAYGFAARDILTNILSSYYGKDRFRPGMRVRIGSDEGIVEEIDSIRITLRTSDRVVMIPTKQLITDRIEVLSEGEEG